MNTFREVAERYIALPSKNLGRKKKGDVSRVKRLVARFGDKPIDSFTPIDMSDLEEEMLIRGNPSNGGGGFKASTINSHKRTFRAILNYAKDRRGLIGDDDVPSYTGLNESEDKRNPQVLSEGQIQRMLLCLDLLRGSMMRFGLATGLRVSNIKNLLWLEVADGMIDIPARKMKGGKRLFVPMSDQAKVILAEQKALQDARRQQPKHVFTQKNGRPLAPSTSVTNKAWANAAFNAEVADVNFHDIRHTWATRHAMAGTPLALLQQLGGWSSIDFLIKTYTHLTTSDMHEHVNNGFLGGSNSNTQMGGSEKAKERKVIRQPVSTSVAVKRPSKMVVELGGIEPPTSTLPVFVSKTTATQLN